MKTITISVDDETYDRCQARADAVGASVEQWAAERLAKSAPKSPTESERERLRESWSIVQARIDARAKARGDELRTATKLTRDELHDRDALR